MGDIHVVVVVLIWILIAGIVLWGIQAIGSALALPRVVVIVGQVVVGLVFCIALLRLAGGI